MFRRLISRLGWWLDKLKNRRAHNRWVHVQKTIELLLDEHEREEPDLNWSFTTYKYLRSKGVHPVDIDRAVDRRLHQKDICP